MKNKNVVILVIIVIIALICLAFGLSVFNKTNNKSTGKDLFFDYKDDKSKVVEICKKDNCGVASKLQFYHISVKEDYSKPFANIINEINSEIDNYYNEVKSSEECPNARDTYYHSKYVNVQFENYENNNYVSITPIYSLLNLCDMSPSRPAIKTYIYDKNAKKMLSQEEFIAKEDIAEGEIQTAIKENNKLLKEDGIDLTDKTIDEYTVYFASDGSLCVAYTVGNDTYWGGIK